MPPKPYQNIGIDFLTEKRRAILGDDAGLGKSLQLIRAANRLNAARILILCPAVARGSWKLQLREWDDRARPVHVYPDMGAIPNGPVAVIVTLEWLQKAAAATRLIRELERSGDMDAAFVDEAHMLANDKAQRTKSVYGPRLSLEGGVLERVHGPRWLATATPTPLNVGQLYPHLRALFPDLLNHLFSGQMPNRFAFEARYCKVIETRFGRTIAGNRNDTIAELREALRPYILMRRKADVLTELPPILTIPLPLETGFVALDDLPELPEDELADMTDEEVLSLLSTLERQQGSQRRHLGRAKAEAVMPWVLSFLAADATRKLIIFAHHREVIDLLSDALSAAKFEHITLRGGLTPAQKEANVARFQSVPDVRVAIGQNLAAGTAITLTAADTVLVVEPHPTPDQNYQMISRAHRIGQPNMVTAVFAYDANVPLEVRQVQILRRRAADNEALFGVKTPGVI